MVSYCDNPAYLPIISGNKSLTASLRSENTRKTYILLVLKILNLSIDLNSLTCIPVARNESEIQGSRTAPLKYQERSKTHDTDHLHVHRTPAQSPKAAVFTNKYLELVQGGRLTHVSEDALRIRTMGAISGKSSKCMINKIMAISYWAITLKYKSFISEKQTFMQ